MLGKSLCGSSCLLIAIVAASNAPIAGGAPPNELNMQTLEAWRNAIEPTAEACEYLLIDWETTIRDAVSRAQLEEKPLLIYVMNGHPLGCT